MSEKSDDPAIETRKQTRQKTNLKNLTIAERLTARGNTQKFSIMLDDIEIEVRLPTSKELSDLLTWRNLAAVEEAKGHPGNAQTNLDKFYGLLADLCLDESLTLQFFKSGLYCSADVGVLVEAIQNELSRRIQEVQSFRFQQQGQSPR